MANEDSFSQRTIVLVKTVDGVEINKILDVNITGTLPLITISDKLVQSTKIREHTTTVNADDKLIVLKSLEEVRNVVGASKRFTLIGKSLDSKHNADNYIIYDALFKDIIFVPDYTLIEFKNFNTTSSYPVSASRLGVAKHLPHYTTSYITGIPNDSSDEEFAPMSQTKEEISITTILADIYGLEYSQEDGRGNSYYELNRELGAENTNYGVMSFKSQDISLVCLGTVADFLIDNTNNGDGLPLHNVYKVDPHTYGLRFMGSNCQLDPTTKVYFYVQF